MAHWARILANPKVLKRFLGSKAGRKATFKYGKMLLRSKAVMNLIGTLIGNKGVLAKDDKKFKELEKEYAKLQKHVVKLEAELRQKEGDIDAMQAKTFTLGRQVVEMQRLYDQMQVELQRIQAPQMQQQLAMANAQRVR